MGRATTAMVAPTRLLPVARWPLVLASISVLQVACFRALEPRAAALHLPSEDARWQYQCVTALVAHKDARHLAANVVAQLALGVLVEAVHGHGRLAVLYLVTGVGGTLVFRRWYYAHDYPQPVYYVGCSPAVYGLMAAYSAHLCINWRETMFKGWWLLAVAATAAIDVALFVADPQPHVAYSAHLGGALYGLLAGVLILRNVRVLWWETRLAVVSGLALGLGTVVVLWV